MKMEISRFTSCGFSKANTRFLSMGAPKQKWTSEEESALKAGVVKYGAGKWRTILKDPEFSEVLCLRSNVDLKDKWRNMSVTANGWGSRERARLVLKRSQHGLKHDDNPPTLNTSVVGIDNADEDYHPSISNDLETDHGNGSRRKISRLDNLIMEAITNLKEPCGSNKTAIATYIEDQYWPPPNFKRVISGKLKDMVTSGKLIKVKRKYRIAPISYYRSRRSSGLLSLDLRQNEQISKTARDVFKPLTKSQIDAEFEKMRNMTAAEAAIAAAQAVAEAEAAMTDAEAAAKEAEAAEAEAEAAQAFAEAAAIALKGRNHPKMMAHT